MTEKKTRETDLVNKRHKAISEKCVVVFEPSKVKAEVAAGTLLLEAAHKAGVYVNSICGGAGCCGKCKIVVTEGKYETAPTTLLTDRETAAGTVLACQTRVSSDVRVFIPQTQTQSKGKILQDSQTPKPVNGQFRYEPLVRKLYIEMTPPSIQDHTADYERLCLAIHSRLDVQVTRTDLKLLHKLSGILRNADYRATATIAYAGEGVEIIDIEAGDTSNCSFAVAVDVGTTTVVVHLIDLTDGTTIASEAAYNSQIAFGEDYIARIIYAEQHNAFDEMQSRIVRDINELIAILTSRHNVRTEDLCAVVCAGNTAMLHFLLGLDATRIRREPYIPSAGFVPPLRAADVGIQINESGLLYCLPCVAAYVGGDIVAGVLATQIYAKDALSLFVDMGTNGEVVLGKKDWLVCASSSAGPAFEGGGVKHGMRAAPGAIEKIEISPHGDIQCRTIADAPPIGICGSGLLDALGEFLRCRIIDRTGRFHIGSDSRLTQGQDGWQFQLVPQSSNRQEIVITQADINNLIRAKAGVFAAIKSIMQATHTKIEDLDAVYLAGGFGNFLDIRHAVAIGMLPDVPLEKIHFVGNTSIAGANMVLLSRQALKTAKEIAANMTYFDLMTYTGYMDEFVKAGFLPHTDLSLFPSTMQPTETLQEHKK